MLHRSSTLARRANIPSRLTSAGSNGLIPRTQVKASPRSRSPARKSRSGSKLATHLDEAILNSKLSEEENTELKKKIRDLEEKNIALEASKQTALQQLSEARQEA